MFSYTHTTIRAVDAAEPFSGFHRYEADRSGLLFNVAAVWTWATKSATTSYRQAHEGLRIHGDWIRERPTVILGDFNGNASFKGSNWNQLIELMQKLGLVSVYHAHFKDEPFGQETRPTHFHGGRASKPFHLDYVFLPEAWARLVTGVTVGEHADWYKISDHAPLVVDVAL